MSKILGIVVLYFPQENLIQNIQSYLHEIDQLLLVDNSSPSTGWLAAPLESYGEKISILKNGENLGIAKALNQAAQFGLKKGFDWFLTMDQDSFFEYGALEKMKHFLETSAETVGILAPFHRTPKANPLQPKQLTKQLGITMTSGNLLNAKSYLRCGPFEEKLFIDSVDHEYCLRLRRNGYKIIRLNSAVLYHSLGEIVYHKILFLRFKTTNHNASRRYYIMRNRLYVMFKYAGYDLKFFRRELMESVKAFLTMLFFEQEKIKKTKAMLLGAWHFLIGRYGKI